jgi:hypothetical protein
VQDVDHRVRTIGANIDDKLDQVNRSLSL